MKMQLTQPESVTVIIAEVVEVWKKVPRIVKVVVIGLVVIKMVFMLGANCEFAQFIYCAAHYVNPRIAQQFINCCASCQSYYAWSIYKLRTKITLHNL